MKFGRWHGSGGDARQFGPCAAEAAWHPLEPSGPSLSKRLLARSGQPSAALSAFRQAERLEPSSGKALAGVAFALQLQGQADEATAVDRLSPVAQGPQPQHSRAKQVTLSEHPLEALNGHGATGRAALALLHLTHLPAHPHSPPGGAAARPGPKADPGPRPGGLLLLWPRRAPAPLPRRADAGARGAGGLSLSPSE